MVARIRNMSVSRYNQFPHYFLFPCLLMFALVFAAGANCTGNINGTCNELDPATTCTLTRAAVGSSLDNTQDEDRGRTSFARFPVEFVHDGATSNFTVTAIPNADTDSGSSITERDCSGSVTAFFAGSGPKTVRIRVFQLAFARSLDSSNSLRVIFDRLAPILTPLQVFIGTDNSTQPLGYSAGATYYTSTDVFLTGRIQDPAPSVPNENLAVQVIEGLTDIGQIQAGTGESPGLFAIPLGVAQEPVDGEYLVKVAPWDSPSGAFEDTSPANMGEPIQVRVVLDRRAPLMTKLEIIRRPGTDEQRVVEAPNVFVGRETIQVRATFSEELQTPPTLTLTHLGNGVGTPPDPYKAIFDQTLFVADQKIVTYTVTPQTGINDIGPVNFAFSENGADLAGNPVSLTEGVLANGGNIERAIIVDTVAPDINRVNSSPGGGAAQVGVIQAEPAPNSKVRKGAFPKEITIIVKDYNLPDNLPSDADVDLLARGSASGVDFSQVAASPGDEGIQVEFLDPNQNAIRGTLATKPPNGLVYILPDESRIFADQPDRIAPEGVYTVRVTMRDKVGNEGTEVFSFEVDNRDVEPSSVRVSIDPFRAPGDNFSADSGNPILANPISGVSIPDNPNTVNLNSVTAVRELQTIRVCSNDPSFDVTRSQIQFLARLNGPDTIARQMNVDRTVDAQTTDNDCSLPGQISVSPGDQTSVFPSINFPFPNPAQIGNGVVEGDRDPRFGLYDGPYIVSIIARDDAGNLSDPIQREFLLDTTTPATRAVFPENFSKINSPLRHFSAIVVDPHPPRLHVTDKDGHINFGSGISEDFSGMDARLSTPYRPDDLDETLFNINDNNRIRGRLVYTHRPNNFDASLPSFNEKDDAYRILLEFVDNVGNTRTLPQDGTADGIYTIEVTPVDNAGNSIDGAANSGWRVPGDVDLNGPNELRKNFFFLLDTVAPNLSLNRINGKEVEGRIQVAGNSFSVSGTAKDLSAKEAPEEGGSGLDRVEYELVLLQSDGSLALQAGESANSGKRNPLMTGVATLSDFVNESANPHVSETKPLDAATYPTIKLENRDWRIDAELPSRDRILTKLDIQNPSTANYFLRIYAYDIAGNRTQTSIQVDLTLGELRPPELIEPLLNQHVKSSAVTMKWKAVEFAADYVVYLSTPSGTLTTFQVVPEGNEEEVETVKILIDNGLYEWWVVPRDSVGNKGSESFKQKFTVDTKAPRVELVTFSDITPDKIGTVTRGEFKIEVHFDGELEKGPLVTYQPFLSSLPHQLVSTDSLIGKVWRGTARIPEEADNSWNGQAILWIQSAQDKAGNRMQVDKSNTFEIETGPSYRVKFFENPVNGDELILVIRASEELAQIPLVINPVDVQMLNSEVLKINNFSYVTYLKLLDGVAPTQASLTIAGRDLLGNSTSRIVTFPVAAFHGKEGGQLNSSRMKVEMGAGSFEGIERIGILPSEADEELPSNIQASVSKVQNRGLRETTTLVHLYPSSLSLQKAVTGTFRLGRKLASREGFYVNSPEDGRMVWVDSQEVAHGYYRMQLLAMGSVYLGVDEKPPEIELGAEYMEASSMSSLEFEVQDYGSGLSDAVEVSLGGELLDVQSSELPGGRLLARVKLPRLDDGQEYDLEVQARDRVGNASISRAVVFVPSPMKIVSQAFPNPARSYSTIQYDLSRQANRVELKLYDAGGRLVFHRDSSQDPSLGMSRGRHTYEWYLENDRGLEIANGVYFCHLFAVGDDGSTDKVRLKIAVLR